MPFIPTLHVSQRIHFQLYHTNQTPHRSEDNNTNHLIRKGTNLEYPNILNVGCSDDPVGLAGAAVHFDMDDWSQYFEHFVQGDAHRLPYIANRFHTVVLGDILEHVIDPPTVIKEAMRVSSKWVVMTIFEEWRLKEFGKNIKLGQALSDIDSRAAGYKDREDAQLKMFPQREGVDDTEKPHLCHIWQFNDEYIVELVAMINQTEGWSTPRFAKLKEAEYKDGHDIYNWLLCAERHI